MKPRVRFAPSPTGYVHIGSLRTALYDYLYAKGQGGTFVIRVEDTDQTRLVGDAVEGMVYALKWAGIEADEGPVADENGVIHEIGDFGPYTQSDRLDIYKPYAEQLIENGHAYHCFCTKERLDALRQEQKEQGLTPKYDGHCRNLSKEEVDQRIAAGESYVVRLKLPENRVIAFDDRVKGHIEVNTNDMDDQVLMKADGFPTYHMAVVVDDHLMEITQVIRGDEWLISTPKHVYLYEAFGWEAPEFVHLPVILSKSKKKLSKREGDVAVEDFRRKGYLPEALVNYVALVGWSPDTEEEIFDMQALIEHFSFERVSKSSGIFDLDKLNWVNNHYIRSYPIEKLTALCKPYFVEVGYCDEATFEAEFDKMCQVVEVLRERLNKLEEIKEHLALFMSDDVHPEDDEAREVLSQEHIADLLNVFVGKLEACDTLTAEDVKPMLKEIQKETGYKGKMLFMPVRVAVTGQVHGPDIAQIMGILGKDSVIRRVKFTQSQM
ncbi:MAG: nondiscriminating glutamyl-tRNA synthetase [Clostridiales bacterium]|jgi:nondiscriminating glutamyl-tRNA synthetase|nr:nondiscriminating glutamyl-tRNA synthetase [Clostridiales bacterium]